MYCITRTRKDGSIVNAIAAQVVADIKAIGDSSTDQETTNNSDWTNDDLSKVKGPERRGSVRYTGKFLVRNDKRSHDPQVPLLKAQVKYLRQGFMMLAAAVQEQVPNLNLSSVMNFMNMEVDDLSSIHDNTTGKTPSSASGTSHHQNSHFRLHVQALTLAALAGAAVVEYYDHKTCAKSERGCWLSTKDSLKYLRRQLLEALILLVCLRLRTDQQTFLLWIQLRRQGSCICIFGEFANKGLKEAEVDSQKVTWLTRYALQQVEQMTKESELRLAQLQGQLLMH